jgi:hypothetical protein
MEQRALLKSPVNSMRFEKCATANAFWGKARTYADKKQTNKQNKTKIRALVIKSAASDFLG